ncbi:tellurite resistance TerB family protein [Thauera linaloolentis]|uniref:Tellurite resistance TerB family protein n=1 Tax=Thauera linaloolentis (strain DSM 12138 / JCM 21573 / CCUG 41526 / CIP 105981 / IAM 15112 / NBRC 102519 / 47Lol) TaxID=1123367 RepID=N6Y3J1_THAL4|nr:tellurite resistance TerB family protein [Thauera linaloolentis]ENO88766.1 hypothetical protein C666_08060 [Thauera linaloolentis 47Lol = DSM 12138]MCM8564925.1 tellurite resistance TerB family protein [Thauera linaloolentis]
MSFGNIIGQILQQGMANQSRSRLDHTLGPAGLGGVGDLGDLLGTVLGAGGGGRGGAGGGLGDVLGSVLGSQGASRGGAGNLGDLLGGLLGGASTGRSGAGGGLGDLLGGVLGGGGTSRSGSSNPLGGTGMAILATLAMAALKNWQGSRSAAAGFASAQASGASGQIEAAQLAAMTSPETEELVLRAMISAAKADGEVDEDEIQRIVGKIGEDGITAEEKQFVAAELRRPLDLESLIAAVPDQAIAAQVYGASLLAIHLDTEAELAYLRQLARGLGLDADTVARLHQLTGVQA